MVIAAGALAVGAEEEETPGNAVHTLEVVREVLTAEDGRVFDELFAGTLEDVLHALDRERRVDGRRVAADLLDFDDLGAGEQLHDDPDLLLHEIHHRHVLVARQHGPEAVPDLRLLGQDVAASAGVLDDRLECGRVERIHVTSHERVHHMSDHVGDASAVDAGVRFHDVAAARLDLDHEAAGIAHDGAGPAVEHAGNAGTFRVVPDVEAIRRGDAVKHAVFLHHHLAAGFGTRCGARVFFGALEDQAQVVFELHVVEPKLALDHLLGEAKQHGRVDVMPAGMHDPGHPRFAGQTRGFDDGQRVDVGAQDDAVVLAADVEVDDEAPLAPLDVDADRVRVLGLQSFDLALDEKERVVLIPAETRMLVEDVAGVEDEVFGISRDRTKKRVEVRHDLTPH